MSDAPASEIQFKVVLNEEEQYSIWPAHRSPPEGWAAAGFVGSEQSCLDYIDKVWVDMRPLSLRKQMSEEQAS